jgi:SAM-dependent methyltransferase
MRKQSHSADPRPLERLRHHYQVEKGLADQLRGAPSRAERARIYETMYDTLFAAVPDHPRRRPAAFADLVARRNARTARLLGRWLTPRTRVLMVGAGDCSLAHLVCARARSVHGLEITDASARPESPDNFLLVLYDGFEFPFAEGSFQFAFSDQLVEHLHPDDAVYHFRSVLRTLAPGGTYLFRTPHRFNGPHDISRYFTDGDPEGFHLKEWTYRELNATLAACGYDAITAVWHTRGRSVRMPVPVATALEAVLDRLPRRLKRRVSVYFFPSIVAAARKPAGA